MSSEAVEWRPDGTPFNARYGDVYRSGGHDGLGGLRQARQVFLAGCGLLSSPANQPEIDGAPLWRGAAQWRVLETGFGLGLNFLATWQAWRRDPERPARLHFASVEAHPVSADDLRRSAAGFAAIDSDLRPMAEELAAQWWGLLPGFHRLRLDGGRVQLTLAVGDVAAMLREFDNAFDSIYLDGFSPDCNPAMWSDATLRGVARLARRHARLATWCVASDVRDRLARCGFVCERVPGPPPKEQVLRAKFAPAWKPRNAPRDAHPLAPSSAVVIGGGISGASVARALAERGWQVTVLDRAEAPAAGASGLPAGLVAPHTTPDDTPLSRLTRAGVRATLAAARTLLREGEHWAPTGVLERRWDNRHALPADWLAAAEQGVDHPGLAWTRPASAMQCEAAALDSSPSADDTQKSPQVGMVSGDSATTLEAPGSSTGLPSHPHWHACAAWLRPGELVRALLDHPRIAWRGGAHVAGVARRPPSESESTSHQTTPGSASDAPDPAPQWRAVDAQGQTLASAHLVVLAAGFDTLALAAPHVPDHTLPLHALRGQVSWAPLPAGQPHDADRAWPPFPVNGHGSLIPHWPSAEGPAWIVGSTFERGVTEPCINPAEHALNEERLRTLLPRAADHVAPQFNGGSVHAWAGVRATVPDRVPALGALPDRSADHQKKDRSAGNGSGESAIESEAFSAGLQIQTCTAMGARGLTLAVLCGELLAARLHGEPLSVEASLAARLNASRWRQRSH